ncbi:5-(carboxyamino)imidazole ribonucleotide synthase [Synechococcus sp. CBW1006]|uniref:5-(carboxyamino)imidazole ribonucleotide synthase n=1 Tax=Synechococcus sp. CBW1006 TaxID=1353138 RepID=UPI0018CCA2AB|nr:5-(carboxyamino)imidazole ribonucleotide synthase [Synechococcus sp. CBW1006]QPN66411.1 5-(carboxyamino)imidazole ribonucleotide synthase [Synechococcus sp. CBW1006]
MTPLDDSKAAAIGVVGGGQLARMLAQAAAELGVPLHVQTPSASDPAAPLAAELVLADLSDAAATRRLAEDCAAISFENEWLDLEALAPLADDGIRFIPSLEALQPLISKRSQRELQQRLQLPSPRWFPLDLALPPLLPVPAAAVAGPAGVPAGSADAALPSADTDGIGSATSDRRAPRLPQGFSYPLMAKAARGGYDGKGTALLQGPEDLEELLERVDPATWIVEEFVAFEQELSVVACRDRHGRVLCYPVVQTHQHQQVCDWVLAPAAVPHAVQAYARNVASSLLTALDYVGVLSIEFFYGPAGLLINEIAPRTHNSGHYTIEAARTSQFAQQVRIVADLPIASPDLTVPGALMVNLLGFEQGNADYGPQRAALAQLPAAHVHWYDKTGSSLGRKLGHVTLLLKGASHEARATEAERRLAEVRTIWPLPAAQPDGLEDARRAPISA